MDKISRIRFLRMLGFNTPRYIVVDSVSKLNFLDSEKEWSIRSFDKKNRTKPLKFIKLIKKKYNIEEDYYPPHIPVVDAARAKEFCIDLLSFGITPIACPAINPKDALFAGAAQKESGEATLEIAYGPVMVRKVTREGKIDLGYTMPCLSAVPYLNITEDEAVNRGITAVLRDVCSLLPEGYLVELSYYKNPLGMKHLRQIYWDIYPINQYPGGK